jgi:hypothetical protein
MKIKRLLILCGILVMLLVVSYQPTRATTVPIQVEQAILKIRVEHFIHAVRRHHRRMKIACAHCEDIMEEALISCLQNGGGDWCWGAAKAVYCQCQAVECGGGSTNGCDLQ